MSFHNVCDPAMAVSPKQPDDDTENNYEEADDQDIDDDNENEQDEPEDSDFENEESGNNEEEPEEEKSGEEEHEKEKYFICEIFSRVFVNDSWSCSLQVEKPYYLAGIYPDIIFVSNAEVLKLLKLQKVNSHIAVFVVTILMFQKNI
jgi:hypothetical protein